MISDFRFAVHRVIFRILDAAQRAHARTLPHDHPARAYLLGAADVSTPVLLDALTAPASN